jgi:3-hydroxypropanoate dehydrogenase
MSQTLANAALDTLFHEARTYSAWQDRPVPDQTLRDLYDLLKWAPTSANAAPARFAFLRSPEAKARLRPALAPLNVQKTMTAPVTVIVAYDLKFYDQLPTLFPHNPGMKQLFASNPELVEATAKRNSRLAGRVPDHGSPGARSRLRTDVRLRSREGGRGVLCRRQALFRLRSGVLP